MVRTGRSIIFVVRSGRLRSGHGTSNSPVCNLGIFVVSSEVKTEQNWLFNILDLRLLSECSWPFSFKGETPFPSCS